MAEQSARSQTTGAIFFIVAIILVAGIGILFFMPGSPFRPEASEQTSTTPGSQVSTLQEFRDGQISSIRGDTVTVDEPNGGTFSFSLGDDIVVRGLNNEGVFEVSERGRLTPGDFISVFYEYSDATQRISRIDIVRE